MPELVQTTALDLGIGAAMMALPVALGIALQFFSSLLLRLCNRRGK